MSDMSANQPPDWIQELLAGSQASASTSILDAVWGGAISQETAIEYRQRRQSYRPRAGWGGAGQDMGRRASGSTWEGVNGSQIFNEIFEVSQTDPERWQSIQRQLYLGGFYGNRDLDQISFGEIDAVDVDAIGEVLTWTARHNAADKERGGKGDLSWEAVLGRYASTKIGAKMEELAKSKARAAKTVSLADPTGLAQGLDQMAQNVLGRKATADEKKIFVATFHAMQSGAQLAEGGTVVTPDAAGQAEALLRGRNAAEAGAHDMSNTFNDFLAILSGGFE